MQLLLFLLMCFTFLSFAALMINWLLPLMTGVTVAEALSVNTSTQGAIVKVAILTQGASNFFIYGVTALTFAYLAHPRPGNYLGMRKPGRSMHFFLAIGIMLGAMPVLSGIEQLIGQINFGNDIKEAQKRNDEMFKAFLNMPDLVSFLRVFTAIAIIPAVSEELFFRGLLMRFTKKRSRTMLMPVLFTSAVFAYSHTNIYGLLPIFIAGILLAVIYNLTSSIWCSIAAHLCFNGSQVVLFYLGNYSKAIKGFVSGDSVSLALVAGGACLFAASFYLLLKNKTPLQPNWSDDFTREELAEVIIDKYN